MSEKIEIGKNKKNKIQFIGQGKIVSTDSALPEDPKALNEQIVRIFAKEDDKNQFLKCDAGYFNVFVDGKKKGFIHYVMNEKISIEQYKNNDRMILVFTSEREITFNPVNNRYACPAGRPVAYPGTTF